jgi:hypothetical protein
VIYTGPWGSGAAGVDCAVRNLERLPLRRVDRIVEGAGPGHVVGCAFVHASIQSTGADRPACRGGPVPRNPVVVVRIDGSYI